MPDQQHTLLKAKRVIDGSGAPAREDAAVLIADGVIGEVGHRDEIVAPPEAEVIDLGERTLMPGIVDAHVHFSAMGRTGRLAACRAIPGFIARCGSRVRPKGCCRGRHHGGALSGIGTHRSLAAKCDQ